MNIKTKTTLIILVTFIIGMAAGSMVTQVFIKYRMKKVLSMRVPEGFADHFERIIEPTPEQREAVREILYKYGKKMAEEGEKMREQFEANREALNKELEAILTPEQKKRLEERFFAPGHGDRPPGPPWMRVPPDKEGKMPPPPWFRGFPGPDGKPQLPPWHKELPPQEKKQDKKQESPTGDNKK